MQRKQSVNCNFFALFFLDFDLSIIDKWVNEKKEYFLNKHSGNDGTCSVRK